MVPILLCVILSSRLHSMEQDMQQIKQMLEQICSLLGGRAAEQLTQDDVCTGASNDMQRATDIARKMVTKYGMSEKLGSRTFGSNGEVFIGRDYGRTQDYSEHVAAQIDEGCYKAECCTHNHK